MLPVIAVVILLFVQFGIAMMHWNNVTQAAGDAARFAAVNRDPSLALDRVTDQLKSGGGQVQSGATLCVSLPDGPDVGDPVHVEVRAPVGWMIDVPDFGLDVDFDKQLVGKATMRLERKATFTAATC